MFSIKINPVQLTLDVDDLPHETNSRQSQQPQIFTQNPPVSTNQSITSSQQSIF
ncbi:hypothetical protein ENUP19_0038G0012 [Entamoeba nuttalli]|uniref:Uncharacterized protein n=1 Tax=Entamoeba nuttalli TaxID=412467 RepID=A0ABQ0D9U7_9EUKA